MILVNMFQHLKLKKNNSLWPWNENAIWCNGDKVKARIKTNYFIIISWYKLSHGLRTPNGGKNQRTLKFQLMCRQNMFRLYLKNWEWELIFCRSVKLISSPGVRELSVLTQPVWTWKRGKFMSKLIVCICMICRLLSNSSQKG